MGRLCDLFGGQKAAKEPVTMRRVAMMASVLLLSGCAGSGFWGFLGDSFTLPGANPNIPGGSSETMRKVRAEPVEPQLLMQEPGNVWPGPPPPTPTLQDVEKQQNQDVQKQMGAGAGTAVPGDAPAATGPGLLPAPPGHRQPIPGQAAGSGPDNLPPSLRSYLTPKGAAGTPARGGTIMVPNGNGTSTVIGPDGSVTTVPTPK